MGEGFWGDVPPATPVSPEEAVALVRSVFGVEGRARPLGSNQETNLRIDAGDSSYVLKVANPAFGADVLDLQNSAMLHVAAHTDLAVPRPAQAVDGSALVRVDVRGVPHHVRLLTFVAGDLLADAVYLADSVLAAFGGLTGRLGAAFADFDHPAADRLLQYDNRRAEEVVAALAGSVLDADRRASAIALTTHAWAALRPLAADLRTQVVHADVADYNVVARPRPDGRPDPCGVIDFGDVTRSWLVADLATAIASVLVRTHRPPLLDACAVAAGYHRVLPLTEAEVSALWPLVAARAAVLAVSVEDILRTDPDNSYAREERPLDWLILDRVASVPFALAHEALRLALGLGPSPTVRAGASWRPQRPVVDPTDLPRGQQPVALDLSVRSELLHDGIWADPVSAADAASASLGARAGLAPYGQARLTSVVTDSAAETPTTSLGIDLVVPAGTPVRAPAAATVRAVRADEVVLGCDGVDILLAGVDAVVREEAALAAGTLVGHVSAGESSSLPPHLHVQLVAVPGMAAPTHAEPSLAEPWLALCPDPTALVGVPSLGATTPADTRGEQLLLARRDAVVARVQEHYYARPPQIERGWRHHLVDTRGRAYLDVVNNVTVLGHSHPAVTAAATRQLRLLNTNSRFLYDAVVRFGERIVELLPDPLDTVFFVNSGSEAVDLALRLARTVTGRRDVVCLCGGYHGWTTAADEISTTLNDNPRALATRPPWVHLAPMPNLYRGEYRGPDASARYAEALGDVVARIEDGPAAFVCEPLSGNAGGVEIPPGYLPRVYEAVRDAGGLCVSDEVQVGYGRLGSHFWGFETHGVVPDVITMAKAAGNGYPLGFVVTRRAVAEAFATEGSFFSSVGGSPVSSAVGLAVLDTIRDEDLQGNARRVGAHLKARLEELASRRTLPEIPGRSHRSGVGTVHGQGLYLGVELVRDRDTLEPASEEAFAVCERLRELGVVSYPTGDFSNVLKVKPPLCITEESADFFVDRLDEVLRDGW